MNKLQKRRGFTLTELAVVIAVIAVLIAVLVPTFYALLNKANVSSDSQLTKTMNDAITIEDATSGIETPEDAITAALSVGYSVENLSAKSEGNVIVYDQESKSFVLISDDLETVQYNDTKDNYKTATTWLFLETSDSSVVTSAGTNTYTINGTNSYILIGEEWNNAKVTVQSASGIDTSQVSVTSVTTTNTASSASVNHVAAKTAVAEGNASTTTYPLLYNVKGAYLTYKGGSDDVKIFGSQYVSLALKADNSNKITIAKTVKYVDVTASKTESGEGNVTVKVEVESGGSTQIISNDSVTVTNTSGSKLDVTLVADSYGSAEQGEEATDVEEIITDNSQGVYSVDIDKTTTIAPTCTESGYTQTTYVNNYTGETITVISDIKDPTGHNYEASWTWAGDHSTATVTFTCSVCDEKTENHSYIENAEVTSETTDATCTASGKTVYTATVTSNGTTYTDTKEVTIEAKGHTNAEAVTENYVAATCTEDGSYDSVVYCSVCGAEISRTTMTVSATGHSYTSEVTTEPTCTEAGVKTYTCANCGDTYTEEISATGHTEGEAVIENEVAATASTDGSYDSVVYCSVCGAEISRETITELSTDNKNTAMLNSYLEAETPTTIGDVIDILVAKGYSENIALSTANRVYKWDKELNVIVIYDTANSKVITSDYSGNTANLCNFSADLNEYSGFAYGDGTESNPYQIATLAQLESLRTQIERDGNLTSGVYYQLVRNLELGSTWEPLGSVLYSTDDGETYYVDQASYSSYSFQGTLDGNNYEITIHDSSICDAWYSDYALFANVKNATIKNLNICMNVVNGYNFSCGAVAAYTENTTIENIKVTGTITATAYAGGVVGWEARSTTFKDCVNEATIKTTDFNWSGDYAGHTFIGGIAAQAYNTSSFVNCSNTGTLTHKENWSWTVDNYYGFNYSIGQIVGYIKYQVTDLDSYFSNCTGSGEVTVYVNGNDGTLQDYETGAYNFVGTYIIEENSVIDFGECWNDEDQDYNTPLVYVEAASGSVDNGHSLYGSMA